MIIKNIIRIIKIYKLALIKIIYYELLYLLRGYKGNKFNLINNKLIADNIPCPYYFLIRIEKTLKNLNFQTFLDLGCGYGRVLNFFNKRLKNKNFIGIDYFIEPIINCKKIFTDFHNIKLIQQDIIKIDFLQYEADCYFLNEPIKDNMIFTEVIKKIVDTQSINKKIFFIFVNCNIDVIKSLRNIEFIENYYLGKNKGYSICSIRNEKKI